MSGIFLNIGWFPIMLMVIFSMAVKEVEAKVPVHNLNQSIAAEAVDPSNGYGVDGRFIPGVIQYFSPVINTYHSIKTEGIQGGRLFIGGGETKTLCWASRKVGKKYDVTGGLKGVNKRYAHHFVIMGDDGFLLADAVVVTKEIQNGLQPQFTDDCTVQF
jgi:hypothetical protein